MINKLIFLLLTIYIFNSCGEDTKKHSLHKKGKSLINNEKGEIQEIDKIIIDSLGKIGFLLTGVDTFKLNDNFINDNINFSNKNFHDFDGYKQINILSLDGIISNKEYNLEADYRLYNIKPKIFISVWKFNNLDNLKETILHLNKYNTKELFFIYKSKILWWEKCDMIFILRANGSFFDPKLDSIKQFIEKIPCLCP